MLKVIFFFAVTVFAIALSSQMHGRTEDEAQMFCHMESDVEAYTMKQLRNFIRRNMTVAPELNCYYKCVLEQFQLFDINDVYTPRKYVEYSKEILNVPLTDTEVDEAVESLGKCEIAEVVDPCERAVKMIKCVYKKYTSRASLVKAQYYVH